MPSGDFIPHFERLSNEDRHTQLNNTRVEYNTGFFFLRPFRLPKGVLSLYEANQALPMILIIQIQEQLRRVPLFINQDFRKKLLRGKRAVFIHKIDGDRSELAVSC